MKKKVLIVSFFAFILILVPINSVIGVSDSEIEVNNQNVRKLNPILVRFLSARLIMVINLISYRFSYNSEVVAVCNEILEILNNGLFEIICDAILSSLIDLVNALLKIPIPDESILNLVILALVGSILYVIGIVAQICGYESGLTLQTNLHLMQGNVVECSCMQQ